MHERGVLSQGEFTFINLGSMNRVTGWRWDEILMPDTVIDQVNALVQG